MRARVVSLTDQTVLLIVLRSMLLFAGTCFVGWNDENELAGRRDDRRARWMDS